MKSIITVILLFLSITGFSQNWIWVNSGGGSEQDYGVTVAITPDGTIFCMGKTQSNVTHFGSVNLSSVGEWNTFVCTYTSNGNLINATATSGNTGIGGSIVAFGIKNTECSGYFINADFAGGAFFDTVYVNLIGSVIAKYNNNARCLWVKPDDYRIQYSGMGMDGGYIYAQGEFSGVGAMVDTFTLDTAKGTSFIVRLDTNGNCLWVKQAKGLHPSFKNVKNGRIYSRGGGGGGIFSYDTTNVTLPNSTSYSYVIQMDTGGRLKSYNIFYSGTAAQSITADANHNYYAAGVFLVPSVIGIDTLNLGTNTQQDGFFAKFDTTGAVQWVKQFYSNIAAYVTSSVTDNAGNTYITGSFRGKLVFGDDTITAQSTTDMFVVCYNTNGVCLGAKIVPYASGESIALDANGDVIVTGAARPGATFDNLTFPAYGSSDFFVAKLGAITGIATSVEDERLVIYPNPNKKLFTIEVPQSIIHTNSAMLDIYDNAGNAVQHGTIDISSGKVQVDIGTVQKGIYNVTLSTSKKKFTGRLVVE